MTQAQPGDCIALAPGSYDLVVAIAGGVHLLGKSYDVVHVRGVVIAAGSGSVVRGLEVGIGVAPADCGLAEHCEKEEQRCEAQACGPGYLRALDYQCNLQECLSGASEGVILEGAGDVLLEAVRIVNSTASAVELRGGASVTMRSSELRGAGTYGIEAFSGARVELDRTIVFDSAGPGVWAECVGCPCAETFEVVLRSSVVRGNEIVGVALVGVDAVLDGLDVLNTLLRPNTFVAGGGMWIGGCSAVTAGAVRINDNTAYGLLIDGSSAASFGADEHGGPVEVSGNQIYGVWVHDTQDRQVRLENFLVAENSVVGLGFSGDTRSLVIRGGRVERTLLEVIPVLVEGAAAPAEIGDGISWQDGASATIQGLVLDGNPRAALIIDGPCGPGSSISNLTLTGGDEAKAFLQQNLPEGGPSPTVEDTTKPLEEHAGSVFVVPPAPASSAP
jgi:hypothetical protein